MRLPAALEQWAAEHSEQLSGHTLAEVNAIASAIADSPAGERSIYEPGTDIDQVLAGLFPQARAERAVTVVQVVAQWAAKLPSDTRPGDTQPSDTQPSEPQAAQAQARTSQQSQVPQSQAPASSALVPSPITTPAPFRSDKVDEEDDARLYGPKRPWKPIVGTLVALAMLGAIAFAGWYWFSQRDDAADSTTPLIDATTPTPESSDSSTTEPTAPAEPPTAIPEPTPVLPSYWADTTPILNSGTAEISSSTYVVSPANRAVLTGHTAAITGIITSDDGRVLTSGADRRLVDWGADVTLAEPDVLNVSSPVTVLARTADQRIIAGDNIGSITVIDLVNTVEPIVVSVHDVAISAVGEVSDGRFAIASVDGDVAIFNVDTPDETVTLPHGNEVTAVVGLPDGQVATAAVDGLVRLWTPGADGEPDEISTLGSPVTSLALLSNGTLATASVTGQIHIVAATPGASPTIEIVGHEGAVRSLHEFPLADGTLALASGGDDTTVRLWNLATGELLRVLEGHGDIISGLDSLPDGRLLSTSGDGTGRVWDLDVPPSRQVIPPHVSNLSAVHPWNNDQFITGGTDGRVTLSSTSETSEPVLITSHGAPIVGVGKLEQSGDIVSLDASSVLRVNQATGDLAGLLEFNVAAGATALGIADLGSAVTGHADGSVRLYDFEREVAVMEVHGSGVNDLLTLANGLVVSAGQDMTVRIVDFAEPDRVPVFDLHTAPVDVLAELPDGRIASAGSDGIYVWTVEGLTQDHIRLNGQRARTISLIGLPNDRLISTGDDGRVRLWDLTTPEAEPVTLVDIPGIVNPYLMQADNGLFVAGAARGYVVFTLS